MATIISKENKQGRRILLQESTEGKTLRCKMEEGVLACSKVDQCVRAGDCCVYYFRLLSLTAVVVWCLRLFLCSEIIFFVCCWGAM